MEAEVPPGDAFWHELDVTPAGTLSVELEAQPAGPDVVVRGQLVGEFALSCRRCLEPVTVAIDEPIGLLYREGEPEEDGEVLALPDSDELDVTGPVREQVLLSVPRYAYCRENCRGLCPHCGTNLNEATCGCTVEEEDARWAPLRRLKKDA
jgi:uncharacterized protein